MSKLASIFRERDDSTFEFNFGMAALSFSEQDLSAGIETSSHTKDVKKKKKKKKQKKNETTNKATEKPEISTIYDESSDDDDVDNLKVMCAPSISSVEVKNETKPSAIENKKIKSTLPTPSFEVQAKGAEVPPLSKNQNKKKKKAKKQVEEKDDESWFDPQPKVSSPAKTSSSLGGVPFIKSSKNPALDPLSQQKLKYGDGKNIVAIGPPKVKNNTWANAAEDPIATSSSPFAFAFSLR